MLKPILFTIPLCVAIPMISHATVGGGQYIEFLGYEPTDKKVYLLRHYEDGRGRLPQLYYYQFYKANQPPKLFKVNSLYINQRTRKIDYDQSIDVLRPELNKIKQRLQPLQLITPKIFNIHILKKQQTNVPAIWIDKTLKVPQYTYQYKVSSIWFNSQLQQAVSYKPSLSVKQAYYIPAQNQVLVTVRYLAFPEETGYTTEDPISLTVKSKI